MKNNDLKIAVAGTGYVGLSMAMMWKIRYIQGIYSGETD